MTRTLLALLCLMLLATAGMADDEMKSKVDAFFKKFDANQNGTVTPDEFNNDKIFQGLDTNRDGKIDRADFGSKPEQTDKPKPREADRNDGDKMRGQKSSLLRRFDRNQDGKIDRREMRGHEQLFHQLDTNNDGELDNMEAGKASPDQMRQLQDRRGRDGNGEMDERGSRGDDFRNKNNNKRGKKGRGPWQRMMQQGDTNSDGKLSEKEWVAMQKDVFQQIDKDGNGSVSEQELSEHFKARMKRGRRGQGQDGKRGSRENQEMEGDKPSNEMAKRIFKRMDRDGDGKISKDEAPERLLQSWDRVDTDGDGSASEQEFTKAFVEQMKRGQGDKQRKRGGQEGDRKEGDRKEEDMDQRRQRDQRGGGDSSDRVNNFLKRMDKNGDGKISKDEAPERLPFDRLDTDGDGSITKEELEKAFQRRGQNKQEKRPGDN